jgi:unsaturated chondroitin disaccharide hydrolase
MNLPLLYWASEELKDSRFRTVAENHTRTAAKYLVRNDGTCNHIVVLDANTGEYLDNPGGQGYESGSSWSRGQSWGIYGMALAYRYTHNTEYLDIAKQIAHYFIANVALTNYVSVIDFRAPKEPVYYDTTATACTICGLLELSEHVAEFEKVLYIEAAIKMLEGLDKDFINKNLDIDGILTHGSGRYHREHDREVPIIYGDYFLVEAVLRLLDKDFKLW